MFEIYIENQQEEYQILNLNEAYENFQNIKKLNRVYFKNNLGQFFDFDEIAKELTDIIEQKDITRFSKAINTLIDFNNSEIGKLMKFLDNGFEILKTETIKNNYHITSDGSTKKITILEIKHLSISFD